MCEPTTILALTAVSGLISTAGSVVSQRAAHRKEKAQNDAMLQQHKWENEKRNKDAAQQHAQQNTAQREAGEDAASQENEIMKEARAARAQARVAAGESGVAGATVQRLQDSISMQEGMDLGSIEMNKDRRINQLQAEKRATTLRAETAPALTYMSGSPNYGLTIAGGLASTGANVGMAHNSIYGNKNK